MHDRKPWILLVCTRSTSIRLQLPLVSPTAPAGTLERDAHTGEEGEGTQHTRRACVARSGCPRAAEYKKGPGAEPPPELESVQREKEPSREEKKRSIDSLLSDGEWNTFSFSLLFLLLLCISGPFPVSVSRFLSLCVCMCVCVCVCSCGRLVALCKPMPLSSPPAHVCIRFSRSLVLPWSSHCC